MKKKNYLLYDFVKITAAIPGFIWMRIKRVYENENAKKKIKGGAILIANHSGNFDPIVLMFGIYERRHHFVATTELFRTKFTRFLFENFHCIEVDKENVGMDMFREVIDCLKDEKLVSLFPEGGLNRAEEMQKFKSGMVLMAHSARKPIIPIYIKPRKNLLERQCIVIGEAINPSEKLGKMPKLSEMDEIAKELEIKEGELKRIAENL